MPTRWRRLLPPGRVERVVEIFSEDCGMVYCPLYILNDETGRIFKKRIRLISGDLRGDVKKCSFILDS
jgi:Zn-finger protein